MRWNDGAKRGAASMGLTPETSETIENAATALPNCAGQAILTGPAFGVFMAAEEKPPRQVAPLLHDDGIHRCPWAGADPLYMAYHDEEWGVPEWESRALFEKLILDGFQAGLYWITILRKRDAFRAAFDGFVPEKIARYGPAKVETLMQDAGIVRDRAKLG